MRGWWTTMLALTAVTGCNALTGVSALERVGEVTSESFDGGVFSGRETESNTGASSGAELEGTAERAYRVGGTVTGLSGSGLVLRNNGGDDLPVSSGAFTFEASVSDGAPYAVTVHTDPREPPQRCVVVNGSGVIRGADVSDVRVECKSQEFKVGGTVVGLSGAGLLLRLNGSSDVTLAGNGSFEFPTTVPTGAPFEVKVIAQPPLNMCTVSGGTGTVGEADVQSVVVNCSAFEFTVGGTVSGLVGTVVLGNSWGVPLTVTSNGTFAFPIPRAMGTAYAVKVNAQPTSPQSQTCTVERGVGVLGPANVTDVRVTCAANKFPVGGTVTGLVGNLTLTTSGALPLTLTADGAFAFSPALPSGSSYAVTVSTQPVGRSCTVANGSGKVAGAAVTDVRVTCSPQSATPLVESFDGVASPALPNAWVTTRLVGPVDVDVFTTNRSNRDTQPNAAYLPGYYRPSDVVLTSPAFAVATSTAVVSFVHRVRLESSREVGYDAAVLEIGLDGGPFVDIIAAGGTFLEGGYSHRSSNNFGNPLGDRPCWSGSSGLGFDDVRVRLPPQAAAKTARLRWRLATDQANGSSGWWIDNVEVRN